MTDARRGQRLLLVATALARTGAGSPGCAGTTRTCRGTAWSAASPSSGPTGCPGPAAVVAGDASTWTSQPRWSPDGSLVVASEPGEWIGLHRWDGERLVAADRRDRRRVRRPRLGVRARPRTASAGDGTIVAIGRADGRDRLWRIDPAGERAATAVDLPFTYITDLAVRGGEAAAIVAAPAMFRTLVRIDLATGAWTPCARSSDLHLDPAVVSVGEPVEFPTTGDRTAHGILYRPTNPASGRPTGSCRRWSSRATAVRQSATSHRPSPAVPAAHEPRDRGARRRLRRQHRLRQGLPEAPRGHLGRHRRRRLRRRRAGDGPPRRGRPGARRDRGRQRVRLHDARGPRVPRRLPGGRQLLRHREPRDVRQPRRTSSSPATSIA